MPPVLPVPLARLTMSLMPAPLLARGVAIVTRRMESRHPNLFKNLARLDRAKVLLLPTDLPHRFALTMGEGNVSFYVAQDAEEDCAARVVGSLQAMVDMLEGRADGDTLFFARDIQITGDTSVIVALRNTLDREEIDLYQEIISLCGPFAQPVAMGLGLLDRAAQRLHNRMTSLHDEMHRGKGNAAP